MDHSQPSERMMLTLKTTSNIDYVDKYNDRETGQNENDNRYLSQKVINVLSLIKIKHPQL